ncbi:glycosyltransferase [Rhodosalinus sp. K401]|uniref:glycosyltransferase n=1 Tax=Rhodosalinus sp. K401 TaxID=3239195 RepID=UPI0035265113
MQAIGLCRFSYPAIGGFQVEHDNLRARLDYLYAPDRMEERFRLFETVALPSLRAQTDPAFDLVVVAGDSLPAPHLARLRAALKDLPQAQLRLEPPRRHRAAMKDLLQAARRQPDRPCLQFRFDDDDAVAVDFVEKLKSAAAECRDLLAAHRSVAIDFASGYHAAFGPGGIRAAALFRPYYTAALGMSVRGGDTRTIMNFAHHRIHRFMPAICFPEPAMFVRGLGRFNDSRAGVPWPADLRPLSAAEEETFRARFALDADAIRRAFAGEHGASG